MKGERWYEIDGQRFPSVTTILSAISKPALAPWMAKMERIYLLAALHDILTDPEHPGDPDAVIESVQALAKEKKAGEVEKDKAGEIGSQAHALIEWATKTELGIPCDARPQVKDEAELAYMSWEDWRKKSRFTPLRTEITVYSKRHGFAGTLDLEGEDQGVPTIVDYKTGKKIWPEAYLQNWAYRIARCEMLDRSPGEFQGRIIRLPKTLDDPIFEVGIVPDDPELFNIFLATKKLWEWQRGNG